MRIFESRQSTTCGTPNKELALAHTLVKVVGGEKGEVTRVAWELALPECRNERSCTHALWN